MKAQVIKRARELDVTIIDDGYVVEIICPPGKVLRSTDTHMVLAEYRSSWERTPKSEAWASLLEDMADGLEDSDDPEIQDTEPFPASGEVIYASSHHPFLKR